MSTAVKSVKTVKKDSKPLKPCKANRANKANKPAKPVDKSDEADRVRRSVRHAKEMCDLQKQLNPSVNAMLNDFRRTAKKGIVLVKTLATATDTIGKYVGAATPEEMVMMALFMHAAKNDPVAYAYHCAELNGRWGSVSYFDKYALAGGYGYELISPDARVYRKFSKIVYGVKKEQKGKDRLIGLSGIVKANGGDHYVAMVTGGNNGPSNWSAYLETLKKIVDRHGRAWIVEVNQSSDVYYALIGFEAK